MLTSIGVEYVIIGLVNGGGILLKPMKPSTKRVKAALAAGLKPIICVGESLEQREKGHHEEIVSLQSKLALEGAYQGAGGRRCHRL